jgi:hypothetical protein
LAAVTVSVGVDRIVVGNIRYAKAAVVLSQKPDTPFSPMLKA